MGVGGGRGASGKKAGEEGRGESAKRERGSWMECAKRDEE